MMEVITTNNTNTNTNTNTITITNTTPITNSNSKSPETESETPTRIQQQPTNTNSNTITKPLSFSNGVLKRLHPNTHHHNHNHHHHHNIIHPQTVTLTVTYKECLKNHVASLGGHALDGCCEFMPSPTAAVDDPSSIKCAACGCHRNFHRREPEEPISAVFEYQPHHRHHPPPPSHRSPNSASPPPISSYPSAPHMLLALSGGGGGGGLSVPPENTAAPSNFNSPAGTNRKRFRTKFTQEQKEKMHEFAERVGWKMQKRDEEMVNGFCNEVGVDRGVLKVWMHNNKNTLGRKSEHVNANGSSGAGDGVAAGGSAVNENDNGNNVAATTNGSSSSS